MLFHLLCFAPASDVFIFKNRFLNLVLGIIALLNYLVTNLEWLALRYFHLRGGTLFKSSINIYFSFSKELVSLRINWSLLLKAHSLKQFLTIESPVEMTKHAIYFISSALFVLEIFKFLSWLFGYLEKRLDKKAMVSFSIYHVTDWTTNNYNKHVT